MKARIVLAKVTPEKIIPQLEANAVQDAEKLYKRHHFKQTMGEIGWGFP